METKNYKFTVPCYKGLNAEDAYNELERIRKKHGVLKPETVVEESKDPKALLHDYFQWNDSLAADAWRKEQARQLIKNITVTIVNEDVEVNVRAIVCVSAAKEFDRSYIPMASAIVNEHAYQDLLAQAKREMDAFVKKYAQISELNGVKAEMLKALDKNV